MEDQKTRREWLRTAAMGSAVAAGLGEFGCNKNKEAAAAAPPATVAALAPAAPVLQIICHGMMFFKMIPSSGNIEGKIEIHIPTISPHGSPAHEYMGGTAGRLGLLDPKDGPYTLKVSGYTVNPGLPTGFKPAEQVLLRDRQCSVKPDSSKTHCVFELPMPSEYQGYKLGGRMNGTLFKAGGSAANCGVNNSLEKLVDVPLVHVFRYGPAKIAEVSNKTGQFWSTAQGNPKFHLVAAPRDSTTPQPNEHHLAEFMTFFNPPHNLTFLKVSELKPKNDMADTNIGSDDLNMSKVFGSSNVAGGSPADCISAFDDGGGS